MKGWGSRDGGINNNNNNNSFNLYSAFQGPKVAYRGIADTDSTPIATKNNTRQSTTGKQKQW